MKNLNKSIISTAVIAVTLSGVLSACSTKKEDIADKSADATKAPEKRGKITATIYDRAQIPAEEGTYTDNRWTKWINQNGPVDVKFVSIPRFESQQKLSTLFAAADAPDLILEYDNAFRNQLWSQKQLMPLDDLIEKYSTEYKKLLAKFPELKKLGSKSDGKMYDFGIVSKPQVLSSLVIRKDWLDKLGLKVPTTVDELYAVANAFANNDPDGNNKKDTFGFNFSQFSQYYIDGMFGNEMFIIKNGELVRQFDRIKPATEFKKKMFDNGIVDKDFLTDKNGQKAQQDFANGKLGIFAGYKSDVKKNYETLKKNDPKAEIIPIAFPASPYGSFGPDISSPLQMVGSINANAKDPAAVIQYIDFMNKPSTVEHFEYGVEGEHYKNDATGCPQPISADKNKKEKDYNGDFKMLMTKYYLKPCVVDGVGINSTNAFDQEWIKISKEMDKLYLDPNHMKEGFTHPNTRPSLDKELNATFNDGYNQMNDFMVKAVVSGDSYTIDQAFKDVQNAWDKTGGKKLEDWYKNWYKENKDKWVFNSDIYKMKVE
ncbi:extracellular solute-binding protein [Paenibacillus whitsoniae]|uniref:Extracellular solute-binding protein n=1 Tax=Paenibacillus whitsoniae TaxID=2496558 RepID=A0A3S0A317_9BACL|nr:extracellular solute-binding protein [Paenibacillus whitsoniae]RTE08369.1 extracellular solute-binding protein [Paenibacillus whitsoniae]